MYYFWAFFVVALWILCQLSDKFKYHVKYVGYCLYCIFIAACSGLFCLFYKPRSSMNIFIPQFFIKWTGFKWLFGINLKYENLEILHNVKKPCVVVSNHQTSLDAMLLLIMSPLGVAPLAKRVLLYVPIFGPVCWLCGTIYIDRSKGRSAIQIMKKVGEEMKKNLTTLWIFPEGSRYQQDKLLPFKKGAFHLAVQAGVPIAPVIFGNYRNVIDRKNKKFDGGEIRCICLPPISTEGKTVDDVNDIVESTHKLMSDAFEKDFKSHSHMYKDVTPLKSD
ncbi:1-acyl-sn-glycerol-3-phosphate acyltransferase beta-like [Clytia hemisphaerica]|uniref:1-acyl-sn-glycerol-3-phosphate acyltransferase n=1 Tax=Clytia hemisphaerica TaxID=252671 RepID=A0A7M5UPU8_9CNID|eukprot:TCONS_00007735-protein